jgi:hypothetical protein
MSTIISPKAPRKFLPETYAGNVFLAGLMVLLISLARTPQQFIAPQFWAEDGEVFFNGVNQYGWHTLFMPYNGYFNVLLRGGALVASWLPISLAPSLYLGFSLVSCLILCAVILQIQSLTYGTKQLICLAIMLMPSTGEPFANLTNSQWMFGTALCLIIVYLDEFSARSRPAILSLTALTCLQGPFAMVFLPVAVVRLIMYRDAKRNAPFYLAFAGGTLLTLAVLHIDGRAPLSTYHGTSLFDLLPAWIDSILRNTLGGYGPHNLLGLFLSYALVGSVSVLSCLLFTRRLAPANQSLRRQVGLLWIAMIIYLATIYSSFRYNPEMVSPWIVDRYFFPPFSILTVMLLQMSQTLPQSQKRCITIFLFITAFLSFHMSALFSSESDWMGYVAASHYLSGVTAPVGPWIDPQAADPKASKPKDKGATLWLAFLPDHRSSTTVLPTLFRATLTPTVQMRELINPSGASRYLDLSLIFPATDSYQPSLALLTVNDVTQIRGIGAQGGQFDFVFPMPKDDHLQITLKRSNGETGAVPVQGFAIP